MPSAQLAGFHEFGVAASRAHDKLVKPTRRR